MQPPEGVTPSPESTKPIRTDEAFETLFGKIADNQHLFQDDNDRRAYAELLAYVHLGKEGYVTKMNTDYPAGVQRLKQVYPRERELERSQLEKRYPGQKQRPETGAIESLYEYVTEARATLDRLINDDGTIVQPTPDLVKENMIFTWDKFAGATDWIHVVQHIIGTTRFAANRPATTDKLFN